MNKIILIKLKKIGNSETNLIFNSPQIFITPNFNYLVEILLFFIK
jgi:hypothetical protein